MDDRSFDTLVRSLASGANRRQLLKGLLGLGGVALAGTATSDADAARRPTPTPKPPSCPGQQTWNGSQCVCPTGSDKCGPDCCPAGVAQCCDNACCYGVCYGEELCCPSEQEFCGVSGECCPVGWTCCSDYGCLSPDQCCFDADCPTEFCFNSECTADRVCSEPVPDCNIGGAEACCPYGQICLEDGSCCLPSCNGCGGADGCGQICGCPDGMSCRNGGCFTECDTPNAVCTSESCICGYTSEEDALYCINLDIDVGLCSRDAGCPSGTFCSWLLSGREEPPFLCVAPC